MNIYPFVSNMVAFHDEIWHAEYDSNKEIKKD
jgi:hypothetical protein